MKRVLTSDGHRVSVVKHGKRLKASAVADVPTLCSCDEDGTVPVRLAKDQVDAYIGASAMLKKKLSCKTLNRAIRAMVAADYLGDEITLKVCSIRTREQIAPARHHASHSCHGN